VERGENQPLGDVAPYGCYTNVSGTGRRGEAVLNPVHLAVAPNKSEALLAGRAELNASVHASQPRPTDTAYPSNAPRQLQGCLHRQDRTWLNAPSARPFHVCV
jgi:hypothetical protein